jgi:hypothetical protein
VGVRNTISQENRLQNGILVEGTVVITSPTSADLSGWAWVIDFAIQEGADQTIAITAPDATFPRIDYFHGDDAGLIYYAAGILDGAGNSIFPTIPAGNVILKKVLRNTDGTNDEVPIEDQIRDPALPFVSYEVIQGRPAGEKAKARTNIGSHASIPQIVTDNGTIHNLVKTSNCIVFTGTVSDINLTGIAGGVDGEIVSLVNITGFNLFVETQNTGSSASNRIALGFTIPHLGKADIQYRATTNRWISAAGVGANISFLTVRFPNDTASSLGVDIRNTVAVNPGGFFMQQRGSTLIRARGDSLTGYYILRLQNNSAIAGGQTVFEVARTDGSPWCLSRSAGAEFLTRRDELKINYPQTVATTGTINDLVINPDTKLLVLSGADDLTGVIGEEGQELLIYASGADRIIRNENAGSAAVNRFSIGADLTIVNGRFERFVKILSRWRIKN